LIEFLKKLSDSIYDTQQECHLKKRLFGILCKSIENDGCITRSQGPIDAQVAFVEYLITEDLVRTYDLNQFDDNGEGSKDETNRVYEDMVKKYFDFLSKLVLHHIYIYPRLSVKGTASPRSCFSGVLTTLLCGPPGVYSGDNININNNKKKTSLFDTSMPNFSMYSSSSQNFNSIPFQSPYIYHSSQGNYGAQSSHHHHHHHQQQQQQQQHQANTTNSIQSVLCNRDMLICLLLKCAVNLITDIKLNEINGSARNRNRNNKKKKFENAEEAIKSKLLNY